ncbi:hypothetical protein [Miltoncostaea oceani]|uniref:hypothetical protein n=1 Tax=Miltoncostaea oceani TaxID=2843216 RepID=UPI001C3DF173|nr:hypothetical protein [Miltoncostaea oceani]
MQILIAREKHGDAIYDVSTPDDLSRVSVHLLRERSEWFCTPDEMYPASAAPAPLSEEELAKLPPDMQRELKRRLANHTREASAREGYQRWWDEVQQVLSAGDRTITVGRGRWERTTSLAFTLLEQRADHEYEGFEVVSPTRIPPPEAEISVD